MKSGDGVKHGKKGKAPKRFFVLVLGELAAGLLAYFYKKNKNKIFQFSKNEKNEFEKFVMKKKNIRSFWSATKKNLKDFFIPHEGNNHRPKSLHPRALSAYVLAALIIKMAATGFLFFIYPDQASMTRIVANEMIQITNQERERNNLLPLKVNSILAEAALRKGEDMVERGYFAHDTPEGKKPWNWIDKNEYDYIFAGENLAMDFTSGDMIHEAFMKSPSHKKNLLDPDYQEVGVAVVSGKIYGNDTDILVMFFGTRKNDFLVAKKNTGSPDVQKSAQPLQAQPALTQPVEKPSQATQPQSAQPVKIQPPPTILETPMDLNSAAPFVASADQGVVVLGAEKKYPNELIVFIIEWMRILFISFILYIGMCLVLNVFIKIRIQHQSVILQSFVVLSLMLSLLIIKLHFVERIASQLKIL